MKCDLWFEKKNTVFFRTTASTNGFYHHWWIQPKTFSRHFKTFLKFYAENFLILFLSFLDKTYLTPERSSIPLFYRKTSVFDQNFHISWSLSVWFQAAYVFPLFKLKSGAKLRWKAVNFPFSCHLLLSIDALVSISENAENRVEFEEEKRFSLKQLINSWSNRWPLQFDIKQMGNVDWNFAVWMLFDSQDLCNFSLFRNVCVWNTWICKSKLQLKILFITY